MDPPPYSSVDEQASSKNNTDFVYHNYPQSNDATSTGVEARFSPRANFAALTHLLSELNDFHKKRSSKHLMYIAIAFGILAFIGLVLLLVSFALPKCTYTYDTCPMTNTVFLVIGSSLLGTGLFTILLIGCYGYYLVKRQFNDLHDIESREQPTIWRLEGDEWLRYLNYIHGPDRQWRELAPLSSFCCRQSSYDRLSNRQYGHIILFSKGFIIDELHFISFRTYALTGVEILAADQQTHGLRIHTYLSAGKNSRNVYFDLFAPSSVTMNQVQTIAQSYNATISGFSGLDAALGGMVLSVAVINLLR